ncbi:MAG: T9SS type A sorting domain-containing protein [Bacteroidales bacterium]
MITKLMNRRILILPVFLLSVLSINAQIPNPSFENWTQNGPHFDPTGWTSSNVASTQFNIYTFCEKDTDHTDGNFSCLLTTKYDSFSTSTDPAIICSRELTFSTFVFKYPGFPYTQRPVALGGDWKYFVQWSEESCGIIVLLTKWNTQTHARDTIGFGIIESTSQPQLTWQSFTCNIDYYNTLFPDSAAIKMYSGAGGATVGDYLKVDNLHFIDSTVNAEELHTTERRDLVLYPNPNGGDFRIWIPDVSIEDAVISIFNNLGQCEYRNMILNCGSHPVSIESGLPKGIYYLNVETKRTNRHQKLIVN